MGSGQWVREEGLFESLAFAKLFASSASADEREGKAIPECGSFVR
jgi:hypothetical protein